MTPPIYLTLAQVKAYMPTSDVSTTNIWDAFITTICNNVSRAWDILTFREEGAYAIQADTTRYYDGVPLTATDGINSLYTDEFVAITTIGLAPSGGNVYTPMSADDFWLYPYNALTQGKPFYRVDLTGLGSVQKWPSRPHSIQIVGKFGYSATVPPAVFEGLLLYVIKFLRKAQTNYLETGTILDTGQVFVGLKTDADIQNLIQIYQRSRV